MKILVTGGAGFIGSNFLNMFVPKRLNALFVNVDRLTYAGERKNVLVARSKNYRFEKADIRDRARLARIFKKYRPTGVIHFAAESHVDASIKNPSIFVETNVIGTHNLLALSAAYGVKRFLLVSTDEVYGSLGRRGKPFTEESPLCPNNPYAASKAAADLLARSYHRTFSFPVVITRSSNNYGPNQDTTKLIPLFISRLRAGKKVPLYGSGANIRDWLFVEDNVRAIDLVFRKGRGGEIYNIGSGQELSNRELTRKLLAETGRDKRLIDHVADRPGHDFRYALDFGKIKKELGWEPRISFEEGLHRTVSHYRG